MRKIKLNNTIIGRNLPIRVLYTYYVSYVYNNIKCTASFTEFSDNNIKRLRVRTRRWQDVLLFMYCSGASSIYAVKETHNNKNKSAP